MTSEADLDRRLDRDPRDIEALVAKGEARGAAGDHRAATAFYKSAVAAANAMGNVPATLGSPLERALKGLSDAQQIFLDHLEKALADAGFPEGRRPERFQHALDLMLGRRQITLGLQRPTAFYFPGLAPQRYFDPTAFAWAPALQAATDIILAELTTAEANDGNRFAPYMVADPDRPRTDFHGLRDNPSWSTLQLWERGGASNFAECFPQTLAAVEATDLPRISVRAPNILFSRLQAGARIPPHHGMLNTRLICHLPLIVPSDCGFKVGGETRAWKRGELLIFDDTIEHEAWNDSSDDRTILIFDAWHPDLDADERQAVTTMFEAIDNY